VLPDSLRHRPVAGARLSGGVLRITFDDLPRAAGKPPSPTRAPAGVAARGR
jgi:hypothetical protein